MVDMNKTPMSKDKWNPFKTSGTEWELIVNTFRSSSSQSSNITRTLALAAIALIWVFKTSTTVGNDTTFKLDPVLMSAAYWVIVSLFIDLLHYLYKTSAWEIAKWRAYKKIGKDAPEKTDKAPVWHYINWPTTLLFYGKTVTLLIGYYHIFSFLSNNIS